MSQNEMLPIDLDFEHPMMRWPAPEERMGVHIRDLRTEIARSMSALDGQINYGPVVEYLRTVYDLSTLGHASNFLWMLGQIQWQAIKATDRIDDRLATLGPGNPTLPRLLRSNRGTIEVQAARLTRMSVSTIERH